MTTALTPRTRLLVVEDEAVVALDIEARLRTLGYDVVAAVDGARERRRVGERGEKHDGDVDGAREAVDAAQALRPDLVLMDIRLRDGTDGIDAAHEIRSSMDVPVVFLTAFSDPATLARAKAASPHGYILKPVEDSDLRTTIEIALHRDGIERALRRSQEDLLAILDAQRAGVILVDRGGQVLFANRALLAMVDVEDDSQPQTLRTWPNVLALDAADRARVDATLRLAMEERQKIRARLTGRGTTDHIVEIEIQDDPRDPGRRIFFVYDVSEVANLRRLLQEQARFHDIVGRSDAIRDVGQRITEVAPTDATVLITGETGTGKELVARAIHRESARRDGPFVVINCAGISEDLAASQLFGHRRGAFTGAVNDTVGVFEAATDGTLFLDELGDLPPRVQTTLLRAVEERAIVRVGDTQPRPVNARIVAATSRDLTAEVAAGRFRSDLLYRIRVGRIVVPPLRARREDIWLLVRHALAEQQAVTGRSIEMVSPDALRALAAYDWPGNVRELRNAIGYAAIHCQTATIEIDDLPPELLESIPPTPAVDLPADERGRILTALQRTGGERKAAAALLGIGRATLYRKLGQYGIE
jgi:DNA-binding NtrC family response regulator